MQKFGILIFSIAAAASSSAFAQSSSNSPTSEATPQQTTAVATDGRAQHAALNATVTREQVYQELVAAKKDGSFDRVNKELYSKP
jgi:Domain of unknown function (DUF4148)